jgi:hypothetical protein
MHIFALALSAFAFAEISIMSIVMFYIGVSESNFGAISLGFMDLLLAGLNAFLFALNMGWITM